MLGFVSLRYAGSQITAEFAVLVAIPTLQSVMGVKWAFKPPSPKIGLINPYAPVCPDFGLSLEQKCGVHILRERSIVWASLEVFLTARQLMGECWLLINVFAAVSGEFFYLMGKRNGCILVLMVDGFYV